MFSKPKWLILFILIILFPLSINAASWELYFEDKDGLKYLIDKDSIQKTPENTWLVWRKIIFPKTNKKKETDNAKSDTVKGALDFLRQLERNRQISEYLNEIDCSRKRFKVLQGKTYYENDIDSISTSDWNYFEPNDLDESLYKKICVPESFLKRLKEYFE